MSCMFRFKQNGKSSAWKKSQLVQPVRTTLKNFSETGTVADKLRPGAPKKLSDRDEYAVYRLGRQGPSESVSNITAELNETLKEVQVSRSTVSKLLRKKDLHSYHACKKPTHSGQNE